MKGFRSTLIFAILVVGMGAFSFWEYKKSQQETESKAREDLAVSLKKDDVTEVRRKSVEGSFLIVKENGSWIMKEPIADKVDDVAFEDWLGTVTQQKAKDITGQLEGSPDWSKFFISENSSEIEVKAGDKSEKLIFGTSNAFDGSFYIRKGETLLVADAGWARLLERSPTDFRNKKVFDDLGTVESIRISRPSKPSLDLVKKEDEWIVRDQPKLKISSRNINNFLGGLQELQAQAIVANEVTPASKKQFNLAGATTEISLKVKDASAPLVLTLSPPDKAQEVFLVRSGQPAIYKSAKVNLDPVLVGLDYFRDGAEAFKIDWSAADRFVFSVKGRSAETLLKDGKWEMASVPEGYEFKADNVTALKEKLKNLEAVAYPKANVAKWNGDFIEAFKGSERLAKVEFGKEFVSQETAPSNNPLVYAKSSASSETLGVPKSAVDSLWQSLPAVERPKEQPADPAAQPGGHEGHEH